MSKGPESDSSYRTYQADDVETICLVFKSANLGLASDTGYYQIVTSINSHSDPRIRRALRMLTMVLELHKLGFQNVRIVPGMVDSNQVWQCDVTHTGNIDRVNGALLSLDPVDDHIVHYTMVASNEYFGWQDARTDNPRGLASKFIRRFPMIIALGSGRDWEYAGWYVSMLGIAETGCLPVAYADKDLPKRPGSMATVSKSKTSVFIPMPPVVKIT